MASQPPAPPQLFPLVSQPGIKRDGTLLDGYNYTDGQWVRWQRGRAKKMGGYSAMVQNATGPFRQLLVDSRGGTSTVHSFSPWGIERLQFDPTAGAVGAITDRTPPGGGGSGCVLGTVTISGGGVTGIAVTNGGSGYLTAPLVFISGANTTPAAAHAVLTNGVVTSIAIDTAGTGYTTATATAVGFGHNDSYTWQADVMFAGSGSNYAALIAASTPDIDDISSDTNGYVWAGDIRGTAALQPLMDTDGLTPIQVSGGCCVLQPFLVVYGSNGLIRNSDANQISGAPGWQVGGGGYANSANVAGTKIVKGLPVRGGSGAPAGLFWSLDSLIRMSFTGTGTFWQYDTISDDISILAKNSVVEYDGGYYWLALDRFMAYAGVVQEIPNQMNLNWFFDNVNYSARNKIFAVKVPRWGEIHWYYPRGSATECTDCIIYNVREQTWYDNHLSRSAGCSPKVFNHPVMAGTEDEVSTTVLPYTGASAPFANGHAVHGGTSGATGTIYRTTETKLNLVNVVGTFIATETVTDTNTGATCTVSFVPASQQLLAPIWQHEVGRDKVSGQQVLAIASWFQTNVFGFPTGGPMEATKTSVPWMQEPGNAVATRVQWIEPDLIQVGDMTIEVIGRPYAKSPDSAAVTAAYDLPVDGFKIDMKEQRREITFRLTSNVVGGFYEMGAFIAALAPGDVRG